MTTTTYTYIDPINTIYTGGSTTSATSITIRKATDEELQQGFAAISDVLDNHKRALEFMNTQLERQKLQYEELAVTLKKIEQILTKDMGIILD